jgi:hypothetical protein
MGCVRVTARDVAGGVFLVALQFVIVAAVVTYFAAFDAANRPPNGPEFDPNNLSFGVVLYAAALWTARVLFAATVFVPFFIAVNVFANIRLCMSRLKLGEFLIDEDLRIAVSDKVVPEHASRLVAYIYEPLLSNKDVGDVRKKFKENYGFLMDLHTRYKIHKRSGPPAGDDSESESEVGSDGDDETALKKGATA